MLFTDDASSRFFISFAVSGILLIGFFYFTLYYSIPKFYLHRRYGIFTLICVLALALLLGSVWLTEIARHPPPPPGGNINPGMGPLPAFGSAIIRFLVVLLFAFGLSIYSRWRRAEKEKLGAELSYLKAQINPHFLFNTLNSIYSLAIVKSDHTADAVVKLSSIMRYVITDAEHDRVSLEKELKYVSDYIDLQKLRLPPSANVTFTVSGPQAGLTITPLIFVPFIENAFKHGVSTEQESPVIIDISIIGSSLHLWVNNKKMKVKSAKTESSGIGVENTKQRLQLLYAEKHILSVTDNEKEFSVKLVMKLK
ncbi:MAG: signal transduction histidine kinase LytS [Bacteroidetes bacterium]|nr:MAG: signal transduction histidine kinase LytS [Bacteroidota bacterium]